MILAAIVALSTPTGSLRGSWQYRAFNERGDVIAKGPIVFREAIYISLKKDQKAWRYFGDRHLTEEDPTRYGPHGDRLASYPQTLGADIEADGTFRASLYEEWKGHNLLLVGRRKGPIIEGSWFWTTSDQIRTAGRFILKRAE